MISDIIKSFTATVTTDANGYWEYSIPNNCFIGAYSSVVNIFVSLVDLGKAKDDKISIKLVRWDGAVIANTTITLKVFYI